MDRSFTLLIGLSAVLHAGVLMAANVVEAPKLEVRTGPMSVHLAAIPEPVPQIKAIPEPVLEEPAPPKPSPKPVAHKPQAAERPPQLASLASAGVVDVMPRPSARNLPPNYPERARRAGQEGRVVLRMKVLRNGTVSDVRVITSSGYSLLDAAAHRAAEGYVFEPARLAGVAVPHSVVIPFEFSLERQTRSR